jgi:hypothetical protein
MSSDTSALVVIFPTDDVQSIITKIRGAGAAQVDLLVPDNIAALQEPEQCRLLHEAVQQDQIGLMIISSDDRVLNAARACEFQTIAVEGTHVVLPDTPPDLPPATLTPAKTPPEPLPDTSSDTSSDTLPDVSPEPSTPAPAAPAKEEAEAEEEEYDPFAAELDDLGDILSGQKQVQEEDEYDAFASDLDDLSDMLSGRETAKTAEEDEYDAFASDLDDLSDMLSGEEQPTQPKRPQTQSPPQRKRIRPEDIVLSDEEKENAASVRSGGGRRKDDDDGGGLKDKLMGVVAMVMSRLQPASKAGEESKKLSPPVVILLVIIFVVVVAIVLFFANRVTVSVMLPPPPEHDITFQSQPIPIASIDAEPSNMAIQAKPLAEMVVVTETHTVKHEVMSPGTAARGMVTILNEGFQAITLPQGSEFVAKNDQGQEVNLVTDRPITIPPASEVRRGRQIIKTFGEAQATVAARSAGSNSNIPQANSITHIVIPGQSEIPVNVGGLWLEHGPIVGGSEEKVNVVREEDVQEAQSIALASIQNKARQQLEQASGDLELELTTIWPNSDALSQGRGYEVSVIPPVGHMVDDPNNPLMTIVIRGQFSALATPSENRLHEQLYTILPQQLEQEGVLTPEIGLEPSITEWHWDGSRLTADGVLHQSGAMVLPPQVRHDMKESLKGASHEEAQELLDHYQERGIIESYRLPETGTLPRWDLQLTLDVQSPPEPTAVPEGPGPESVQDPPPSEGSTGPITHTIGVTDTSGTITQEP